MIAIWFLQGLEQLRYLQCSQTQFVVLFILNKFEKNNIQKTIIMSDQIKETENTLQKILDSSIDGRNIFGTVVSISKGSDILTCSAGNLKEQSLYFIASVTKLFITAIILKLESIGKLRLDDKISTFLSPDIMKSLHIYRGVDFSGQINIRHLLSHTSGLPDYFMQKRPDGTCLVRELTSGKDREWTFEEVVQVAKSLKPLFKPGQKGKAFYSDTNFQLLGKIIENITGKDLSDVLHEYIFSPTELLNTYLYQDSYDMKPAEIYYRTEYARIPHAMISFWADGAIVSTARETMIFLKAFFNGRLFPKEYIRMIQTWNRIFFPFWYGIGIARFKLPWFFSPFRPVPEIIGHMGTTGAFAYYCQKKDFYITGTINQVHNAGLPYRLIIKILNTIQ